jgi:anti-sigma regulatory factor (Ser/Thr protein kinase)
VDEVLISGWMAGTDALPTVDEASASAAREAVRAAGAALGLDRIVIESVAVAASELVHNQLRHARGGELAVRPVMRGGVAGLEILAADRGPGIASPSVALAGPGRSPGSLGAGLAGARRMTHELDVDVRWGEGTCVRARAFAEKVPRRREVGILGRRLADETVSGDHAIFVREREGEIVLAVIDGIGHGPLAHHASAAAATAFLATQGSSLRLVLEACDAALQGTRGAVMAVARIDEEAGTVTHVGAGNVTSRVEGFGRTYTLATRATTLGSRGSKQKATEETTAIAPGEALIVFTDGLRSRTSLMERPDLLREHPIVIAEWLLTEFGRGTDDALVLVVR